MDDGGILSLVAILNSKSVLQRYFICIRTNGLLVIAKKTGNKMYLKKSLK